MSFLKKCWQSKLGLQASFAAACLIASSANAAIVTYDFRVPLPDGQFAEYPTTSEQPYVMTSTDGSAYALHHLQQRRHQLGLRSRQHAQRNRRGQHPAGAPSHAG